MDKTNAEEIAVSRHGDPALPAAACLDGLARIELGRPAWYSGQIAAVRRLGTHRLLLLREVARDGSALALWVSCVAICAERSIGWAPLLDAEPLPALAVRFRGRFSCCRTTEPLTADIHFPEDIGVCRRSDQPSSGRAGVSPRHEIEPEADGQVERDGKHAAACALRAPGPAPSTDVPESRAPRSSAISRIRIKIRAHRRSAGMSGPTCTLSAGTVVHDHPSIVIKE